MQNRLTYFASISGITDPRLVVIFYDQFIALYNLLGYRDNLNISVDNYSDRVIRFSVLFSTAKDKKETLTQIQSGNMLIYGKQISIIIEDASVRSIFVQLS